MEFNPMWIVVSVAPSLMAMFFAGEYVGRRRERDKADVLHGMIRRDQDMLQQERSYSDRLRGLIDRVTAHVDRSDAMIMALLDDIDMLRKPVIYVPAKQEDDATYSDPPSIREADMQVTMTRRAARSRAREEPAKAVEVRVQDKHVPPANRLTAEEMGMEADDDESA